MYSVFRIEPTFPSAFLTNTSFLQVFDLMEIMPKANKATLTAPIIPVEKFKLGNSTPKRWTRKKLLIKNTVQYKNKPLLEERQKTPKAFVIFFI